MKLENPEEQRTHDERGAKYGDHVKSHRNLGLEWTGLIQNYYNIELPHPIPAHLVELMFVAGKLNRAATDPTGPDHYHDGRIYLAFAKDAALQDPPLGANAEVVDPSDETEPFVVGEE